MSESGPNASPVPELAPTTTHSERVIDVRTIPPPGRHPLILDTFLALRVGTAFELVSDHEPKPLYYEFQAEHTGEFSWDYLERGPRTWRVRIGRTGPAAPARTPSAQV